jgi:hypothetical protein
MPEEVKRERNYFLYILLGGCFFAIISTLYFFYFKEDYNFIVETRCNPEVETCFYRDCTNPNDCPPNNLSYYNQYTLKASDYKACINEDCAFSCTTGVINCLKIECTENDINDGTCLEPSSANQED